MNSVIESKLNKGTRISWLKTVEKGRMIPMKSVATGIRKHMLRSRVRKIKIWEALSVEITEHQIFKGQTYDILGFNVGAYMNVTQEGVVCGLNLVWWGILSSNFQGIERTLSEDLHENLLIYFFHILVTLIFLNKLF